MSDKPITQKICEESNNVDRRDFLKSTLFPTAVAIGYSMVSYRQILAQAKNAGKPALTEKSLNQFIAKLPPAEYEKMAAEAKRDLKGFIKNQFFLTPKQEAELNTLPEGDAKKIADAIVPTATVKARPKVAIKYAKTTPNPNMRTGPGPTYSLTGDVDFPKDGGWGLGFTFTKTN